MTTSIPYNVDLSQNNSLGRRFLHLALQQPGRVALVCPSRRITYGALAAAAANTARKLRSGAAPASVVGILAARGPELVAAMLGCASAGLTFVVLDRSYPRARLLELMVSCRPDVILNATGESGDFAWLGAPVTTPAYWTEDAGADPAAPRFEADPDSPAYLLFTSGSTGKPKCIAVSHRPLLNFIDWQISEFGLKAEDRFTMLSGLSHDPILRDVFTPLSLGAALHIPDQDVILAPGGLRGWLADVAPTIAHMTPPLGQLFIAGAKRETIKSLRYIFWGGDVLRPSLLKAVHAIAPKCAHVNFYGCTETPQAASFARFDGDYECDKVPIGKGVSGFSLQIVDEAGRAADAGETGEIVVDSAYLALGYVSEGSVRPFGADPRRYFTGDFGFVQPDGQIAILGRRDDQVKIRGYRIELAEISTHALDLSGVAQAVTLNVAGPENPRLVLFLGAAETVNATDVLSFLQTRLQSYMQPHAVVVLPSLPLLPNGKYDRARLIALDKRPADDAPAPEAVTPAEGRLIEAWSHGLNGARVTPDSTFVSLGGDSLSLVSAYLALEEIIGIVPPDWAKRTVRDLAAIEAPATRPRIVGLESSIVLRAGAILAVLASHFDFFDFAAGPTSILFIVSGFMFGNTQIYEIERTNSVMPAFRLLRSILVPYFCIIVPLAFLTLPADVPRWPAFLMLNDFIPGNDYRAFGTGFLWFIDCLIHILAIFILIYVAMKAVGLRETAIKATLLICILAGILGRFLLPLAFQPDFYAKKVWYNVFYVTPSSHLATFALAVAAALVTGWKRNALFAIIVIYAFLGFKAYGLKTALMMSFGALIVFFIPQIKLPRVMTPVIYNIAGASLYIYFFHFFVQDIVGDYLNLPAWVSLVVSVGVGVVAWRLWNWALAAVTTGGKKGLVLLRGNSVA